MTRATKLDERMLNAGTTAKFVLLVVLLIASSSMMVLNVALALTAYDGLSCSLAAGIAPGEDSPAEVIAKRGNQWLAYRECSERYAAPPSWWVLVVWWALLAALTALLFRVLPAWKARRGRVVPLAAIDHDGEIHRTVAALVATAGLEWSPRIVVDLTATSAGAVVFGRNKQATVCLHGGLIALRSAAPDRFRAVVLHELAHIANRDVTITYLTVALWRVYLGAALPPFLLWCAWRFWYMSDSEVGGIEAPIVFRALLLIAVLTVLVYLARSDVLRSREIYADLAAVRWGADHGGWTAPTEAEAEQSRGRRALRRFAELWHPHPSWALRRRALTDPAMLFGVDALPLFLTGAAGAIVHTHGMFVLTQYAAITLWAQHAIALTAAGLIAGVVGTALFRAVTHRALGGGAPPSAVRAGWWLGLGMVAGGIVTGQGTINEWVPLRPWILGLVVMAAMAFSWWLVHCARLWVAAWQGRSLRGVMVLSLLASALALSVWFYWWHTQGVAFATGWLPDLAGVRDSVVTFQLGIESDRPPLQLLDRVFARMVSMTDTVAGLPLVIAAFVGVWSVPLLAWTARKPAGRPAWAGDAPWAGGDPRPGEGLPALQRVLIPGAIGGIAGGLALAAVVAGLLAARETETSVARYVVAQMGGFVLTLVIASAVAALLARLAVPTHRLQAALIAGGVAAALAFAILLMWDASELCLPPLNLELAPCATVASPLPLFNSVFVTALPISALIAALIAVPRPLRRPRPSRPGLTAPARIAVIVLLGVNLTVASGYVFQQASFASRLPESADVQRNAVQTMPLDVGTAASPQARALQADAWFDRGGDDLLDTYYRSREELFDAVTLRVDAGYTVDLLTDIGPLCAELVDFSFSASDYFRIPDAEANVLWVTFLLQVWQAGEDCQTGIETNDADLFNSAMQELATAQDTAYEIDEALDAVISAGEG
ncbi:M48 family metallopeptidase [Actinoalloteichus hymeniacidonis]|uniref:Zn-dependent protease with chaperone function n=1 Tax=Actinoalloteichus hymeniacidonis TaxID=340345 RepID=A0AAC9HSE6_9PSEU|nr:M48 family metalloprotease [Actinoalloteichus hymeniacidonis]AOS64568.1 Zn-dependent protease with chaperone function [Actinoalloteichus hymeniacidonis]MBB5907360.1 Zn-dependent protease with chaperone function [Actinoalloteichus hymeniacidonis]